jgi:hypothetical protein
MAGFNPAKHICGLPMAEPKEDAGGSHGNDVKVTLARTAKLSGGQGVVDRDRGGAQTFPGPSYLTRKRRPLSP